MHIIPDRVTRNRIAEIFLFETGMFNTLAEIRKNPEHDLVKAAYRAADRIIGWTTVRDGTP